MLKVSQTTLPGVLLLEPKLFADSRGYFMESWQTHAYAEAGIAGPFVQDNVSVSHKGVLRGLHFQHPHGQGKLVQVLEGEVFDVAVDVRRNSPDFGKWVGVHLSSQNHQQLYIPEGFAHGFCVLSERAVFMYKCTNTYDSQTEKSIRWDDPDLSISWPVARPILSGKDAQARILSEYNEQELPAWSADERR